jgi:hypothetical protein
MENRAAEARLTRAGQLTPLREGRTRLVIGSDGKWAKHDDIMQARLDAGNPEYFKVFDVPADATVSSLGAMAYPASDDIQLLFQIARPQRRGRRPHGS